uniref:Uncharacterized protein n=1 Tax=Ailuropoda melanoleuca TaxID=9646 RepID=A0A7N5KF19_AILME
EAVSIPLEATAQEVLGKLRSRELFQSTWDTAAFIIFLIFLGEHRAAPAAACLYPLLLLQLLQPPCLQTPEGEPRAGEPHLPPGLGRRQGQPGTALGRGGCWDSCGEGPARHTQVKPGRPPGPLLQERPRGVDNLALEP